MTKRKPRPPALPAGLAERYALEKRLASGGSAEVWRGRDRVLDRPVAVKLLHRHLLTDETTRERLVREARAAASLSHPGIVAVHDVSVDDEGAAVVLELVEGESLAARLRRVGILPPREVVRIAAEVAEALAHAHERGIVHRDVKAANVLLGPDGEARLVDFGIARLLDDEASRLTDSGMIAGTLRYLAPEQLRGDPAGPAADIYAVGVMLAELVSGQPPFPADTPLALAEAQQTPPMAVPNAPPALAAIIRQALDPDPDRRPPSAEALAATLRQWLVDDASPQTTGAPPEAPTLPAIPVLPLPPAGPASATAARPGVEGPPGAAALPSPGRPPRRSPAPPWRLSPAAAAAVVAVALFVALVLLLANIGVVVAPGPKPSPTGTPTPSPASPTPSPQPPTLAEALAVFFALVDEGEATGQIDEEAAADLRKRADEISEAAQDGSPGQLNKAIRDLRRDINEFEQDGEIGADRADRLRSAVDDIEAAAR